MADVDKKKRGRPALPKDYSPLNPAPKTTTNKTPRNKLETNQDYLDRLFTKTVRMSKNDKALIEEAAAKAGISVNKFIVDSAVSQAKTLLIKEE